MRHNIDDKKMINSISTFNNFFIMDRPVFSKDERYIVACLYGQYIQIFDRKKVGYIDKIYYPHFSKDFPHRQDKVLDHMFFTHDSQYFIGIVNERPYTIYVFDLEEQVLLKEYVVDHPYSLNPSNINDTIILCEKYVANPQYFSFNILTGAEGPKAQIPNGYTLMDGVDKNNNLVLLNFEQKRISALDPLSKQMSDKINTIKNYVPGYKRNYSKDFEFIIQSINRKDGEITQPIVLYRTEDMAISVNLSERYSDLFDYDVNMKYGMEIHELQISPDLHWATVLSDENLYLIDISFFTSASANQAINLK